MHEPHPERSFDTPAGRVLVFNRPADACAAAARRIAETAAAAVRNRGRSALGLATGKTPVAVYRELVELYRAGRLSLRDASTYNLDEYYPIAPIDPNSYRAYMNKHLLGHVDLPANQAHVLDGTVPEAFVAEHCSEFERWIAADGGLDLQLLGIGRNGHIGFNEPCELSVNEALQLRTRLVSLHPVTKADAAADFGGRVDAVPHRALTLGVASILAARSIVVLAFGPSKVEAVAAALHGPMTARVPASLLQSVAERVTWMVDAAALGESKP